MNRGGVVVEFSNLRAKEIQGVVKYTPNSRRWTVKNRSNHIVGIQLCGSAKHTFSDFEFVISKSCVYFLNQKDDYTVELLEDTQAFSVHFTTEEFVDTDSFCFPVSDPTKFHSLLQTAEAAYHSGTHHLLYSALHQICAEIQRISQKNYAKQDERILIAKSYMDVHFQEKDCLFFPALNIIFSVPYPSAPVQEGPQRTMPARGPHGKCHPSSSVLSDTIWAECQTGLSAPVLLFLRYARFPLL